MRHHRPILFGSTAIGISILIGTSGLCFQRQNVPPSILGHRLLSPIVGLESYTVRREMKLTDEQEEKVKVILEKTREVRRKTESGFGRLSREERQARLAEQRKVYQEANAEATALLSADQLARFNQIRIWIGFPNSLMSEEVITALELAEVQKEALNSIREHLGKKMRELPPFTDGTPEERRSKGQKLVKAMEQEAAEEYLGVLSKDQREKFEKMRGPKFEVEMAEFPTISGDRE